MEDQKRFEDLYKNTSKEYEDFKSKVSSYETQAKEYEAVINGMVESKLKAIPEELHELIPQDMLAHQKLLWISKAEEKGLFNKKEVPVEIGKPMNMGQEKPDINSMNPQQMLLNAYNNLMKKK